MGERTVELVRWVAHVVSQDISTLRLSDTTSPHSDRGWFQRIAFSLGACYLHLDCSGSSAATGSRASHTIRRGGEGPYWASQSHPALWSYNYDLRGWIFRLVRALLGDSSGSSADRGLRSHRVRQNKANGVRKQLGGGFETYWSCLGSQAPSLSILSFMTAQTPSSPLASVLTGSPTTRLCCLPGAPISSTFRHPRTGPWFRNVHRLASAIFP